MPLVNYCRKCKAETPLGEMCPRCGTKLPKTGEMLSFAAVRLPVRDWFCWNNVLRGALPVWALTLVIVVAAEAGAAGNAGVLALLDQGFFWVMLCVLALMLLCVLLLLILQGAEKVHVAIDKTGVHARTYVVQQNPLAVYTRFTTPALAEELAVGDDRPVPDGLMLVRRVTLPWGSIKRVRLWREGGAALFFRPRYWQALAVRCPYGEGPAVEAYVRKKLKRFKHVPVLPLEKPVRGKKK